MERGRRFPVAPLRATMLAAGLLLGGPTQALTLTFSDVSSNGIPAADLNASLDFSVAGSSLTLTLANLTHANVAPAQSYYVNQIYFNFAGDASGFAIVSGPGSLLFDPLSTQPNGYGRFDVRLDLGTAADVPDLRVAPGALETWTIDLGVIATDADFAVFSSLPPGDQPAIAALKFVGGSLDDASAFGAVVPVPAAAWLLGSALVGLGAFARTRCA